MTASTTPGRQSADGGTAGQPGQQAAGPGQPSGLPGRILVLGAIAVVVTVAVAVAAFMVVRKPDAAAPRPSGLPAGVPTSLANEMLLTPLPHQRAPGFTLADQAGRTIALSALRGKVVVLQFMDPHCTDICPIVSQEFVSAYHKLGPAARHVVFAAINVNQYHASVADMATYSRREGLNTIPSWHFFSGSVPALKTAWRDYHITVQAPNPDADIVHTSAIYFIDPQGREAFLASPMVDHQPDGTAFLPARQIAQWATGIALIARHLATQAG
ncbi:MAG TPA: SCO family protein [Streptosporangiaceae bacterium]|nr:SCO family protein [Streptosporangiaceae bacterium]